MEEHDVSGYTITDADRQFAHALGFVAPEVLPLHIARFRTKALNAAKARPEPVPGAAARALVAKAESVLRLWDDYSSQEMFGEALREGMGRHDFDQLNEAFNGLRDVAGDALRADGLAESAPRFHVSQTELEDLVELFCTKNGQGPDCTAEALEAVLAEVGVLARRPAPDVVRPAVCTLDQARRILKATTSPSDPMWRSPHELASAINAELSLAPDGTEDPRASLQEARGAAGEAEALRVRLLEAMGVGPSHRSVETWPWERIISDQAAGLQRWHDKLQQCADLESKLAAVTEELDCSRDRARVTAGRLEAADRHIESLDSDYANERERRIKAERERDEALAKLAEWRAATGWELPSQAGHMRAALAARPAPVVIDEALARRVEELYWSALEGEPMPGLARLGIARDSMLRALRAKFGDRASVSVPQGVPLLFDSLVDQNSPAFLRSKLEATEEIAQGFRADLEKAQSELEARYEAERHHAIVYRERDQLRAELEKTRQEAAMHHASWVTAVNSLYEVNVALGKPAPEKTDNPVQLAKSIYRELATARRKLDLLEAGPDDYTPEQSLKFSLERKHAAEIETVRAELEASRRTIHEIANALGYVDWSDGGRFIQADDTRVVEAAREAAGWQSSYEMYGELSEQYEALRAGVEQVYNWCEQCGDRVTSPKLRALLKPAPAEVEPKRMTEAELRAAGYWQNEFLDWCPPERPVQHPPPVPAMVERVDPGVLPVRPLTTRVEDLEMCTSITDADLRDVERALRTFLADWARGSFNKARAAEVLEALDARKGADRG